MSYKQLQKEMYINRIKYKASMSEIATVLLLYLFVFQGALIDWIPIVGYLDELYALAAVPLAMYWIWLKGGGISVSKQSWRLTLCYMVFILIGFLGSVIYQFQPINYAVIDLLLNVKFPLAILTTVWLTVFRITEWRNELVRKNVKGIIIFLMILLVVDLAFGLSDGDVRYGFTSIDLIYHGTTYLAGVCVYLFGILLLNHENRCLPYVCILFVLMLVTTRSKAIVSGVIWLFCYFWIIKKKKHIKIFHMAIGGLAGVFLAWQQIYYYYIQLAGHSARSVLTLTAVEIAKDYFPVGTGYGTFANYVSGINYSPVYYLYDLHNHGEIGVNARKFLSDTFWPMILAQNGLFGTIFFLLFLLQLLIIIDKMHHYDIRLYAVCLGSFAYLLISSMAESAFVHPSSIPVAITLGFALSSYKDSWRKNK